MEGGGRGGREGGKWIWMDWVWVEIEHGWGIQAGASGGGAVTARWRGSCGSAELAALLLLQFLACQE